MRKQIIAIGTVLATFSLLLLIVPQGNLAFASNETQHYNAGWNDGQYNAQTDWNNGYKTPDQSCPTDHHHTQEYCNGYFAGYGDEWNRSYNIYYSNSGTQQDQTSNVNIHGNNNRVTVNQGQSSDNPDNTNHHHDSGGGNLPNCHAFCIG